jgi:hypothetical protein
LRELAGEWSKQEADEFERNIAACEQIDQEMWQLPDSTNCRNDKYDGDYC